jgi:murein L,D-transpeptidase YafK
MQFEFKVLEDQELNVNYIIVTYKKLVMNIRINFIKPYKVFSSIFYNKDNEYYIDKNNTIKITEDKKEYELDIYKQNNYKTYLEKE